MTELLREYVSSVLVELQRDEEFISTLKMLASPGSGAVGLATQWIKKVESEMRSKLTAASRARVKRFVSRHWPNVLRMSGDHTDAAKRRMFALLDARLLPVLDVE